MLSVVTFFSCCVLLFLCFGSALRESPSSRKAVASPRVSSTLLYSTSSSGQGGSERTKHNMNSPIGFIGLGIMGKGMIKNLVTKLDAGTKFQIWNRSPEICNEIAAAYPGQIEVKENAADVVQGCDVTFSMLSTLDASKAVFDSPSGVIAGVTSGKVIVDCATLTPERMKEQANAIKSKGGLFLEAPVSGSKGPAETGTLIFLCGGDESVFERVKPGLDAMGKASFFFGDVGQGSRVKLVVNMIMGTMMSAFSEGLALGDAAGLPNDKILEVLSLGAMNNPMFNLKGPKMINGDYAPNFPLKHQQKDMRFALELASQLGVSLPTSDAANNEYLKVMDKAGDEDFSAIYTNHKK